MASEAAWKGLAAAREAFAEWRAHRGAAATIALPVPVAHLTFDTGVATDKQFDGDEGQEHPEVRTFARTDAFSLIVRRLEVEQITGRVATRTPSAIPFIVVSGFSLVRLVWFLVLRGSDVEIAVKPRARATGQARVLVA